MADLIPYYSCAPVYLLCTVPIVYIGLVLKGQSGAISVVVALVPPMRHLIAKDDRDLILGHSSKATRAHT